MPKLLLNSEDIDGPMTQDQIKALALSFVVLVDYVEAQHAKCGKRNGQ